MTSLETALLAVKALDGKKGIQIQVIEISDISVLADYMVIATGSSSTHVKALADEVEYQLDSNTWILLDYIDVIVNVFDNEARAFYDLDRMWQDGKPVDISDVITEN